LINFRVGFSGWRATTISPGWGLGGDGAPMKRSDRTPYRRGAISTSSPGLNRGSIEVPVTRNRCRCPNNHSTISPNRLWRRVFGGSGIMIIYAELFMQNYLCKIIYAKLFMQNYLCRIIYAESFMQTTYVGYLSDGVTKELER
jgi:hypothetical protein